MYRGVKAPELGGLTCLIVILEIVAIFQVAEDQVTHMVFEGSGPVEKRLHTIGGAGHRADADELDPSGLKLLEGKIQEPLESLVTGAGLEVGYDDLVIAAESLFDQDVVSELVTQVDLEGFGKKASQGVVLIVEVEHHGIGDVLPEISDEKPGDGGLAGASLGAGSENEGAGPNQPPWVELSSSSSSFKNASICSGVRRSRLYSALGVKVFRRLATVAGWSRLSGMKPPGAVYARDGTWLGLGCGRVGATWLVVAGRVAEGREPEGPRAAVVEAVVFLSLIARR